jgi:hypothetical protein
MHLIMLFLADAKCIIQATGESGHAEYTVVVAGVVLWSYQQPLLDSE